MSETKPEEERDEQPTELTFTPDELLTGVFFREKLTSTIRKIRGRNTPDSPKPDEQPPLDNEEELED